MFFCSLAPRRECVWYSNIMNLSEFGNVFREIEKQLDPPRPLGGDYQTLASASGRNQVDIVFLGTKPNPTGLLLQHHEPTLYELRNHLLKEDMRRSDVVNVIKKWIETRCTCENCSSLR